MRITRWIVFGGLLACQGEADGTSPEGALPDYSNPQSAGSAADTGEGDSQGQETTPVQSDSAVEGAGDPGSNPAFVETGNTASEQQLEGGSDNGSNSDGSATGAADDSSGEQEPSSDEQTQAPPLPELSDVLVFTSTVGYRHDSIEAGVQALTTLGQQNDFSVRQTESAADFTDAELAKYDVVVWLSTTLDVLNDTQQAAFERYIQAGGAWVGIHAASDTEYDWAWYGQLIGGGAWFQDHPTGTPTATLLVDATNADHGSTAHLPAVFEMQDEWYNFQANPSAEVTVVLRLDEGSYNPNDGAQGAMGSDHPIAWYHEYDGGRAWYTGLGHRRELYQDSRFTQHLLGGLRWAAGLTP